MKNKEIKYKNYVEKHCSNPQYFKEKNYKAKILTRSIFLKSKINKNNFGKKRKKTEKKEKKGKVSKKKKKEESTVDYCCNPQCFGVWENSDFRTPFSYMYNVHIIFN